MNAVVVSCVTVFLVCEYLGLGHACFADGQTLICQDIPPSFSPGYSSLVVLIPDLGEINSTMFLSDNLVNVTRLIVKRNVTALLPGALASFHKLHTLILDENALTQIDPAWFSPPNAPPPPLKDLSVVGNHLEVVNESMLGGLLGLTKLNLSGNRIRAVEPGSFSLQTNLVSVDLSRNRLTRLSPLVLGSVGSTVFRLAGNPWDCSCGAVDFVVFLKDLKNRALLEQENEVTCSTPAHLSGQPVWNVSVCGTTPSSSPSPSPWPLSPSSSSPPPSSPPVWSSLSTLPSITTSPSGAAIAANHRPAELSIPTAALIGVMVPLCALLGVLCFMGGLYWRKRRNRVEKAGPSAEEDPNAGRSGRLRPPGSPSADPTKRDGVETVRWHLAESANPTTVRAKSANAVLSTPPFGVAVKESPGVQQTETRLRRPEDTQDTAAPDVRLETETSPQEDGRRHAVKRVPFVSINIEAAPYLSIGPVPPEPEADAADGGQRSKTDDVMRRVASWPLSAAQRQDKRITAGRSEGRHILTTHTATVDAVDTDPEGCGAATAPASSAAGSRPPGGAKGNQTEDVSRLSPTGTAPGPLLQRVTAADATDVRVEPRRSPPAATPRAEDSAADDDESRRWTGVRRSGPAELRPPGRRRVSSTAGGPRVMSDGGDQRERRPYEDLLHEVVQNQGRWTRERWRRTHVNKRWPQQQAADGR